MQLTIIAGDDISSLQVGEDIELEILVSLCKIEIASIADIPLEQLQLIVNGQKIALNSPDLLKKQLKDFDINDGDAIHIGKVQQPLKQPINPSPATSTSSGLSSIISNLVKSIKVPTKRPSEDTQDRMMAERIFDSLSEPVRLDFLKANYPELAEAYEANPTDKEAFVNAFFQAKKDLARKERLMMDETSEEGQRYVAELIERQNIDFMHNFAMEHMPEAFIPVHMLFIRMKINNCPVIAFIDSGAQTSILSESCAKRCNVLRMVDKRIRVRHMDRQSLLVLVKAVRDIAPNVRFNIEIKCAHLLTNGNCGCGHIDRKNIFCIMFSKINNVDFNRHIFFTSYDVYLLEIIYEKRIIIQLKRENVRLKRQINRLKREDIRKQREIEALQKLIREQQAEIDELLKVNAAQKTILKIQTNIIAHLNETLYGSLTNRRPCQNGRKCSFEYYFGYFG